MNERPRPVRRQPRTTTTKNKNIESGELKNKKLRLATENDFETVQDKLRQFEAIQDTPDAIKSAGNREINKLFATGESSEIEIDLKTRKGANFEYTYAKDMETYNKELHQEKVNLERMKLSTKKIKDYIWSVEKKRRAKNIRKYLHRQNQKAENPDKIQNFLTCLPYKQKPVYVDKMYTGPKINMTDDFMAGPGLKTEFWKKDVGNDGRKIVKLKKRWHEGRG